jgi:hypothetical protein
MTREAEPRGKKEKEEKKEESDAQNEEPEEEPEGKEPEQKKAEHIDNKTLELQGVVAAKDKQIKELQEKLENLKQLAKSGDKE